VATLQNGAKIGCYRLDRLLGEGGMGEVWLALDEPADRLVALKFIKPHLLRDPSMRQRFTNEAKTLGKLDHDRIVPLYAVVEQGEHLAFVLKFVQGESLAQRIDRQFPLAAGLILASARDILPALAEAHRRGIIHRDLKPQNILVDSQDRSFLTDFGIAVSDSVERATVGPQAIGTPHYMSPEQILKPREIKVATGGHRTDIYSYGIVLYEMLTGQVPFGQNSGAEETFAIQQAHCSDPPPSPRQIHAAVSPAMEAVVLRCLEKDPAMRYQSCDDLLAAIEAAILQPSARAAASETLIESQSAQPFKPRAATVLTPPPARKRPLLNPLSIAAAALLAIGAAGIGLLSSTGKPAASTPQPADSHPNSPAAAPQSAASPKPQQKHEDAPPPQNKTVAVEPKPAQNPSPAPPQQSPDEANAAALALKADEQYQAGDYCEALATLNQAIDLHPDPRYAKKRQTYVNGCNLH
jgi:serine/threonine-protein kinase